ncbi:MAG TPA: hypothetical protein DDW68_05520 [Verrucomicrobiales bacterium]|nr:hypothetical protein [Verrucomicrobiales bacterium]HBE96612.1 hypothetical protein [Verrucomicrobiales bacterium]
MPPPDHPHQLSKTQKNTLKQWVLQGGKYEGHWAFIPPEKARIVGSSKWGENAIDSFIFKKLTEAGLTPQPEASRETLLRRLSLDLTGLPPILDEQKIFLNDKSPEVKKPGSYAANCLLARRLAERDVRFIQLFHQGWDHHGGLPKALKGQCSDTDHPTAGLLTDLKQRGMLEDTLLVWGGEFGRTTYCQGKLTRENYGRDHHPKCFSMWMAGAGIKKGITIGKTDDYCYNILEDPIHVHDLNATILHLLGVDHERLTYRFQGRQFRLTDVHGKLIKKALS